MQHPDISLIFIHALNAARNYLEEGGVIPVFAYVLAADATDHLQRIVPNPGTGQTDQEVAEQLRAQLRQQAGVQGYRAVAVITTEGMDGRGNGSTIATLQVSVDHSSATPVVWQVPFRRRGDHYEFGGPEGSGVVKQGERFIFAG